MSGERSWTVAVDPRDDAFGTPTRWRFARAGEEFAPPPSTSAPVAGTELRERPSARRSEEERLRRHRERAIAAWLRDLAR